MPDEFFQAALARPAPPTSPRHEACANGCAGHPLWVITIVCGLMAQAALPAFAAPDPMGQVTVDRFASRSPSCTKDDLSLKPAQVAAFFTRARQVSSETLLRDYLWAPCKLVGTLQAGNERCSWELYASAIGTLACPSGTTYHACDEGECDDLLGSTFTDNRER